MQTITYSLSRWTTEELLDEVVRRTATDGPGLQIVERIVIRARLAETDRRLEGGTQSELEHPSPPVGAFGTIEMGLADSED